MRKILFTICLTVLCLTNNFSQTNNNLNQMESEEYVIYSSRLIGGKTWVYSNKTKVVETPKDIKKRIPNLLAETLKDFIVKNKTSVLIEDKFSIRNRFALLDEIEFQKLKNSIIGSRFSKPINVTPVELSRIGFNKNKTQALLFSEFCGRCHPTLAMFVLYEKKDNSWEMADGFTKP